MTTIATEIRDGLTLLWEPGTVVEVRILNTSKGTVSGYFTDLDKLAAAATAWDGKAPAIYITLNPVNPDLLARASKRLREYARETTQDQDIVRRRWLPIDLDPLRPSGISSTDAEHEAALTRAREVRDWFAGGGWPDPAFLDSGNGSHLLFRVDLPNTPDALQLVTRCLEALAFRFADQAVALDLKVGNAARIWKVPGTMACKGDSTPERPHRRSRILEVPDHLIVVPVDLLEGLAAEAPKTDNNGQRPGPAGAFDLDAWLAAHLLPIVTAGPWNGGRRCVLNPCPWNPEHTNRAAFIVQHASGAIAAGCHHNGCSGNDWHALRDLVEPGWRTVRHTKAGFSSETERVHEGTDTTDKPEIDAGDHDLPRVAEAAWEALLKANIPPIIFRYGSLPAWLEDDDGGQLVVHPVTQDRLRHHLARIISWTITKQSKHGKKLQVPALPPMHIVRDMLARPNPPLPILTRLVHSPIVAPDGSLQTSPGYHLATRTFYVPPAGVCIPNVPDDPSDEDVKRAKILLLEELLGDFPFVGEAERAHAVALAVLPFVRELVDGCTPLHLVEKPMAGTGATLLVDVVTSIFTGGRLAALTEGRDDEWRKRLTAKFLTGPSIIVIDNIQRRLESASVSSAITFTMWEDRRLGLTELLHIPVRCAWVATGNNPVLSAEIARRAVRIRLDAKVDRPWLRDAFRHEDLRGWAQAHRGELIWAVLVLIRAWLAAGRTGSSVRFGMFEGWAATMGGILKTAGISGFLANLEEFYEATDTDTGGWRLLVAAWAEQYGDKEVGVSDLWQLVAPADGEPIDLNLDDGKVFNEKSQRTKLGKRLVEMRDRRFGDYRIVMGGKVNRAQRWRLVPAV